jgi:hypothetical protein
VTSTVVIGAEVLDLVRDGLCSQFAVAVGHLASVDERLDAGRYPERYRDPQRCSDALRALLDEIGWSGSPSELEIDPPSDVKIDLEKHACALLEALADQINDHAVKLRDIPGDDELDSASDDEWDEQWRDIVTHDMNALMSLAVVVVVRVQTQLLRPVATRVGSDSMR